MYGKRFGILLSALIGIGLYAYSAEGPGITAEQALQKLKEGNQRFVEGKGAAHNMTAAQLVELAKAQHPFATIITCSDSRVPPELFLDTGFGEIFIIRVAGNVCDIDETGSIEYGTGHLGTPLLVVMGHSNCGAVNAVATKAEVHGSIPELVDNIVPAVEKVQHDHPDLEGNALVSEAVKANVWQSIEDLLRRSEEERELVQSKKLKVIGAIYHLESGKVEWLGEHPEQEKLLAASHESSEHASHAAESTESQSEPTFVHSVYFWLKDGTTQAQKKQIMDDCKTYLGAIETVKKLEVGTPAGTQREVVDNSYAINLIVYFDDKAGHDVYQTHKKHLQFIDRNQKYWQRVQVYDTVKE